MAYSPIPNTSNVSATKLDCTAVTYFLSSHHFTRNRKTQLSTKVCCALGFFFTKFRKNII